MRDQLPDLRPWFAAGAPVAVAVVVGTFASAPLPVGSAMAVGPAGQVIGSVSAGCVEAAVYAECVDAMATGRSALVHYGISDDDALDAGLPCGGSLEVLVTRVDARRFAGLDQLASRVAADRPVLAATVLEAAGPGAGEVRAGMRIVIDETESWGSTGSREVDSAVGTELPALLAGGESGVRTYVCGSVTVRVLVEVFVPRPRLIVFGASEFAVALTSAGAALGWRVSVCDARPLFAAPHRFPAADELVCRWPHDYLADELAAGRIDARTALAVLTHDDRFDVPLLTLALGASEAGYIGAMGSRRTHERRTQALRSAGLDDDRLARLHSPIGLDLGARTPAETAVSIVAEIIASRRGASGRRLAETSGAIHSAGGRSTSNPVARSPHSTATTSVPACAR